MNPLQSTTNETRLGQFNMQKSALHAAINKRRPKSKPKKPLYIQWKEIAEYQFVPQRNKRLESDEKTEIQEYISIACISDTHLQHKQLQMPAADILVLSGDFTNKGSKEESQDVGTWLKGLMADGVYKHTLICAGNHEGYGDMSDPLLLKSVMHDSKSNIHFLHDECFVFNKVKFYGTPWTNNLVDPQKSEEERVRKADTGYCINDKDIVPLYQKIPQDTSRGLLCVSHELYYCICLVSIKYLFAQCIIMGWHCKLEIKKNSKSTPAAE